MALERELDVSPPRLQAKGIVLRVWEPVDATWYVESRDEEVYRWTSESTDLTIEQAKRAIEKHRGRPEHIGFAIADRDTNAPLGNIALVIDDQGKKGEMSFWLAAAARGRGAATAAVTLLTRWAFESFAQLGHIELHILPANLASQRVAERAGFVWAGVVPKAINGQLRDAFVYSRNRE